MIGRREFLKGAAAAATAAAIPTPALAVAGVEAAGWVAEKTWTLRYIVHLRINPTFRPRYSEGDRVKIKFKAHDRDPRTFMSSSLDWEAGTVRHVIPAGAVPWRYVRARWPEAPQKMHRKIERSPLWRKRHPAPQYVVGTQHGWAILPARRIRTTQGAPVNVRSLTAGKGTAR